MPGPKEPEPRSGSTSKAGYRSPAAPRALRMTARGSRPAITTRTFVRMARQLSSAGSDAQVEIRVCRLDSSCAGYFAGQPACAQPLLVSQGLQVAFVADASHREDQLGN